MNLYNLNKEYSLFLFFFNIIVLFTISEFLELKEIVVPYKTAICFFLISIIGVSHGALDHIKGYRLMKIYKIQNKYFFYSIYIFSCLLVISFWMIFPLITLLIFLLVASYHFGKEDSCVGSIIKKKFININILYLFKGSLVVIAPLLFHTKETLQIFQILNVNLSLPHENFLLASLLISFIANWIIMNRSNNGGFFLADWVTILTLNIFFSPLVAFTIYFCFLHSVRHSFGLIYELDKKNFKSGLNSFIKKAQSLTLVTAILFLFSVYFLTNYHVLDNAILKVVFIGLASLTFPHILLEYLLEKNAKQAN
jgi:Brp/Blh family beta-carotene 15,15'-monooxygenase